MPKYPQSNLVYRLFTKGQPVAFGKGEIFIGHNTEPSGIYYLNSGYVKVYSISDDGDEYVHIIYGSGEVFPLLWAYIDAKQESLYYETISSCVLWRVSRDNFKKELIKDSALAYAMSQQLAQQFFIYGARIDNLEYKDIDERVIYRLLFLAHRFGYTEGGETIIDAPVTHELLASTINLARESVSRSIEKLKEEKLINKVGNRIHILDLAALERKIGDPMNFKN